ncbi:hypothetical protein FZEAL_610 [Fusarium zealandicum]|uniref:Uncharacterized protein n=1 Tax=Fusarium zealandicum TaxID=1053134 RepID=A0A8H4UUC5_9HYPO|nr:hypothetical protein FZEAL_610 [Fusarium zealandicum]
MENPPREGSATPASPPATTLSRPFQASHFFQVLVGISSIQVARALTWNKPPAFIGARSAHMAPATSVDPTVQGSSELRLRCHHPPGLQILKAWFAEQAFLDCAHPFSGLHPFGMVVGGTPFLNKHGRIVDLTVFPMRKYIVSLNALLVSHSDLLSSATDASHSTASKRNAYPLLRALFSLTFLLAVF